MNSLGEIDLVHVRRIADSASICANRLGTVGEQILSVLTVLDITAEFGGELAENYAIDVQRMNVRLAMLWGDLWDAVGVPRRPLPRLPGPTRH